ncbi:MAG: ATP-grasp domain-containing protein [Patescibacteria group bacterium]|nr:ATP-grasp domain-containing protein [Patescibacteria group bacterium]
MDKLKKLSTKSAELILEAALEKGLKAKIISRRLNLIKITNNGKSIFIKGTSFPVNAQPSCFIANNKFLTKLILRSSKISTPKSWLVRTPKEAKRQVLKKNLFPCVLKPAKGAHGRRVFAKIESFEEFEELLPLVFTKKGKKDVLIEEFIDGKDYRFLVVGDKVSAVMERVPAHVTGDGEKTIKQLISQFNKQPMVGKKYEKPMCRIKLNGEVERTLRKQNRKLTYVPLEGEKVRLRQNANISTGGIGKDATDKVSSNLKDLAVRAAEAIGISITGVDILYDELSDKAYVLELNDCPGIDIHHYPVVGASHDVARDVIDFLFQ